MFMAAGTCGLPVVAGAGQPLGSRVRLAPSGEECQDRIYARR